MKKLLLSIFGLFGFMILILAVLNTIQFERINRHQKLIQEVDQLSHRFILHAEEFQTLIQTTSQWDELAKQNKIAKQNSSDFWNSYLTDAEKLFENDNLNQLLKKTSILKQVQNQQISLRESESQVQQLMIKIGFKEEGGIGQLRSIVHQLEDQFPSENERILSMRRHEKDFLMRRDSIYIQALEAEWTNWREMGQIPDKLKQYQHSFYSLSRLYHSFYAEKNGWSVVWKSQKDEQVKWWRNIRSELLFQNQLATRKMATWNVWLNGSTLLVCIMLAFVFSQRLTRTVVDFEQNIQLFIESSYAKIPVFKRFPKNEIGLLMAHFQHLSKKINTDVRLLEDRVARRTISLELKNKELEEKQREADQSMRYAQDLQRTLLANTKELNYLFDGCNLFFQPKERVGGDFYWSKHILTEQLDLRFFALADCTGHGVPGALLGVMGMHALDEIVSENQTDPGEILNQLRWYISQRLNRNNKGRQDGMDIALFCYDFKLNKFHFAGAHMPLWLIRSGKIIELKGQRMPVGWSSFIRDSFTTQTWDVMENDRWILFSDGIIDQFGGEKNKKWGKKNFRKWISSQLKNKALNLLQFEEMFAQWKGEEDQTDDCTWIELGPISKMSTFQTEFRQEVEREFFCVPFSTE